MSFKATMKLLFFFVFFCCISFGKLSHVVFDMTFFVEGIITISVDFRSTPCVKSPTADRCIKLKHSEVSTPDTKYLIRSIPFESSLFSEFNLDFSRQYPGTRLKTPTVSHVLNVPCRGYETQILRKPGGSIFVYGPLHHCVDLFQTRSIWILHVYSLEYSWVLLTCELCLNTLRLRGVTIACSRLGHLLL